MSRKGWHVTELNINGKSYRIGMPYNTHKGLMHLNSIDAVNEEFIFIDKKGNFIVIEFIKFL